MSAEARSTFAEARSMSAEARSMSDEARPRVPSLGAMKALNLVTLVVVLAFNGAAGSGAMSGESIGLIANRYASLFLPAGWVFGIWSLIYLALIASAVYQLLPGRGPARAVERLGPWWIVVGVLNVAWVSLFSFAKFGPALAVMVAMLVSLVAATERIRAADAESPGSATVAERLFVRWPFDLYLAWISVALIANTFQYMHVIGWDGFGIPEAAWSVAMMVVATLLGAAMAWARGMWLFPLVVAWAVNGIGARYAELPAIAGPARWLAIGGVVGGLVAWWAGRPRSRG
jgi:hypothetical protein